MGKLRLEEMATLVLKMAKTAGATDSWVDISQCTMFSVQVRDGRVENLEEQETFDLEFCAYIDERSASESTHFRTQKALREFVGRVVSAVPLSSPDPDNELPDAGQMLSASALRDFELLDSNLAAMTCKRATELARRAEAAATSFDPRAKISYGSVYSQSRSTHCYANSRGFMAKIRSGWCQNSVGVVAVSGEEKQVGYFSSCRRYLDELISPEILGRCAALQALNLLNGRPVKSQVVPLVVNGYMAASLLYYFAQAASGDNLCSRQSFLLGKLGQQVAHPDITIVDNPHLRRAMKSCSWSDHGLGTAPREFVKAGVLKNYFLDLYSSRCLGVEPNGGDSTNLSIVAGHLSPEAIVASIDNGLFLEDIAGKGFNCETGDISFSAIGQWIENGKKAFPVRGIVITGNLLEMFQSVEAVGDDLFQGVSTAAPTLKFKSIAVTGE